MLPLELLEILQTAETSYSMCRNYQQRHVNRQSSGSKQKTSSQTHVFQFSFHFPFVPPTPQTCVYSRVPAVCSFITDSSSLAAAANVRSVGQHKVICCHNFSNFDKRIVLLLKVFQGAGKDQLFPSGTCRQAAVHFEVNEEDQRRSWLLGKTAVTQDRLLPLFPCSLSLSPSRLLLFLCRSASDTIFGKRVIERKGRSCCQHIYFCHDTHTLLVRQHENIWS